nr:Gfo/Idh/MocA family oxidoreductase [Candidatus Hydrogenedentota bacterium]
MRHSTRRDFLKAAGTAAAATAWSARSYSQIQGANDRMGVAIIGCGNMGGAHLRTLLGQRDSENIELRAVCDVWQTRANRFRDLAREAGADPVAAQDYRDVLAMKDVDYVVLPLPNHW